MSCNFTKIALIGMMGSGKSAVSKSLSTKTGIIVFELDEIFEKKYKMKISDFFKYKGEKEFRKFESEILAKIVEENENFILSTGGGIILEEKNRKLLFGDKIKTIYLKTSPKAIFERIKHDTTRPLLQTDEQEEKIKEIISARTKFYELADITIETDKKTINETAEEIYRLIWKK